MITDIFDKDIMKILTLFSVSPGAKFTRKEVKEKTLLNNVPLDKAMAILLNNMILAKEKRFLSLNFENKSARMMAETIRGEYLRFKEIPLKVYYSLVEVSSSLSSFKNIRMAYLFGSYAKLIYTERSDIDLAVVMEGGDDTKMIKQGINKIEKRYGKNIELHFFERKDMEQKDPLIREILRNNVILF